MSFMNTFDFIKVKQRIWAKKRKISLVNSKGNKGEPNCTQEYNYTQDIKENLYIPLSKESKEDFIKGNGNELKGKMRALHSSSALIVNVFEFLKVSNQFDILAKSLKIPSIAIESLSYEEKFKIILNRFSPNEEKFKILSNRFSPNIDICFKYKDYITAIESKFTEPYQTSPQEKKDDQENQEEKDDQKEKESFPKEYLNNFSMWKEIPNINKLADDIFKKNKEFKYADAPQLIKHILGLLSNKDGNKKKFRLVYLWYDGFEEEGYNHSCEIKELRDIFKSDNINFQSITWQEVIIKLFKSYDIKDVSKIYKASEYKNYITERYL